MLFRSVSAPAPAARRGGSVARLVGTARARLRQAADTMTPSWAEPPLRRPARPQVRVALVASPRLAAGLALEVSTVDLPATGWPTPAEADLVLLEIRDGAVVSPLISRPAETGPPLVLWATAGGPSAVVAGLVSSAVTVFVADPDDLAAWQEVAPSAQLLPPAATTRRRPVAGARAGAALVAEGSVPPALAGTVSTVVGRALRAVEDRLEVHRSDECGPLPRVLSTASVDRGTAGTAVAVATAAVVVDGVRTRAHDTWSLLEAAASQTAVVTPAGWPVPDGMEPATGADAMTLRAAVVARLEQQELRDREARRLHRALVAGHGLDRRVDRILRAADLHVPASARTVSAVVPTRREHEIDNVLANLGRQSHRETELVLVLHGISADRADLRARARDAGVPELTVVEADPTLTLGACMNLGVDAAAGAWIAKMDDDNHYGVHFLTDLLSSVDTSGAGIVGKWAHYVWLRSTGAVVLRHADAEHSYQRRIQGGSMLFAGDVARGLRFSDIPRAVDSDILDRAIAGGVKVWSADRFNYVSVRGDDRTAHTWTVADDTFLTAAGRLAFFGDPRTHVEV